MNKLVLELENFECYKKERIEFKEGISVITGESGNGKSSIFRAIRYLLLNPAGAQKKIRIGAEEARVRMLYNGNDITWVRTKKDSKYIINGEEYKKVGNTNLFKLLDNTGFVHDIEKNKVHNIEGVREILFPYGLTSSELFRLFENIFTVSDSAKIFQAYKQEEDSLMSNIREAEKDLSRNKEKIKVIEEVQSSINKDKLTELRNRIVTLSEKYGKLLDDYNTIGSIYRYLTLIGDLQQARIITTDSIASYTSMCRDLLELTGLIIYVNIVGNENKKSQVTLENLQKYYTMYKDLQKVQSIINEPDVGSTPLPITPLNNLEVYKNIKNSLGELKSLSNYCKIVKQEGKISEVETIVNKYLEVYNSINKVEELINSADCDTRKVNLLEETIGILNSKLREYEKYRCDKCGRLLVKDVDCE